MVEKHTGKTWLLVTILMLFSISYWMVHIFWVMTYEECYPISDFWFSDSQGIFSPFNMFLAGFSLIGLWSLLNILLIVISGVRKNAPVFLVNILAAFTTLFLLATLRANFEYVEINIGIRAPDEYSIEILEEPDLSFRDDPYFKEEKLWLEFRRKKSCERPVVYGKEEYRVDSEALYLEFEEYKKNINDN